MYCSQCGAQVEGKFCSSCGAPLQTTTLAAGQVTDWAEIIEYQALLRIPEIREVVARHAAQSKKRMTGEQFLQYCDKAFVPLTGVSVSTIASVVQPLYARLGVKTGKTRSQVFDQRPGEILLALLCSLARHGRHLRQVNQVQDGCILEAVIPSDLWSFEGDLVVTVRREGSGTFVEAGTIIKGQLYDWGESNRCLEELFSDLGITPAVI
jgi:hypothetical protein